MNNLPAHNHKVIWISILAAYLLAIFPLDYAFLWLRPEFVALLVVYWAIHLPQQFGLVSAWMSGLGLDIVENSTLGQHALALTVVAYVCLMSYQRIRSYAMWHQSMWIFILVGIHQLFCNWVQSLNGRSADVWEFLIPALASALIWPVVYAVLSTLRIHYRVV